MSSLKVMIKKFAHKGCISLTERDDLLTKLDGHDEQIRVKTIEECKEVVRQHWISGTVAYRIAEEIYGDLEQLKEKKEA